MNNKDIIKLIRPDLSIKEKALKYREAHFNYGENIINGSELFDKIESYEEWLKKVTLNSKKETVDPNWVLTDTFFAVRAADNEIVGITDLRYELNDFLKDLGNCGYSVKPSERRKGYATQILSQICLKAKEHNLNRLRLSAEKNNIGSIKTIIKNGGVITGSFKYENEHINIYTINLN